MLASAAAGPLMLPNLTRRVLEPAGPSNGAQAPVALPAAARPAPATLAGAALRPVGRPLRSLTVAAAAAVDQAASQPAAPEEGLVSCSCTHRKACGAGAAA